MEEGEREREKERARKSNDEAREDSRIIIITGPQLNSSEAVRSTLQRQR